MPTPFFSNPDFRPPQDETFGASLASLHDGGQGSLEASPTELSISEMKDQLRSRHFLVERVSAEIAIKRCESVDEYDGLAYVSPAAERQAFDDHAASVGAAAVSWYQTLSRELENPDENGWISSILEPSEVMEAMASDEERLRRQQGEWPATGESEYGQ